MLEIAGGIVLGYIALVCLPAIVIIGGGLIIGLACLAAYLGFIALVLYIIFVAAFWIIKFAIDYPLISVPIIILWILHSLWNSPKKAKPTEPIVLPKENK